MPATTAAPSAAAPAAAAWRQASADVTAHAAAARQRIALGQRGVACQLYDAAVAMLEDYAAAEKSAHC